MAGEGGIARPMEARVSTGNPSLDRMLEGGLVAHRPYLIVGPSGTGKTTLGIQFLCEGVRRNERVLLVTLEEPPNEARVNHRGLAPELERVEVFDAIPDIMRYERAPFKDIAAVRVSVPFARVPYRIRQSPELASVEVTITALEQMLRTEVIRRGYTRLVVDSLTALQYFCMKGFDPVAGAQSFLRFLSDLRVTTLLTVEAPLEDVETPERMLARGEIRLFRWELDGQTVRAIGVEKFRGSSHDVRLHPYRIGPQGIDINLEVTISRDTRQIIEPIVPRITAPVAETPAAPIISSVTPLIDEVRDLILLGADVAPARSEIAAALAATYEGRPDQTQAHLSRVSSLVVALVDQLSRVSDATTQGDPTAVAALQRVLARADSVRTGVPPTSLPPAPMLQVQLGALLSLLPAPTQGLAAPPSPVSGEPEPVAAIGPETTAATPQAPAGVPAAATEPSRLPPTTETATTPTPAPASSDAVPTPIAPVSPPPSTPPAAAPVAPEPTAPASPPPEAPLAPPSPEPEPPSKPRPSHGLPAPPKPRSAVPPARAVRPTASPATKAGAAKNVETERVAPPPLPSTASPAWPPAPPTPTTPPPGTPVAMPAHPSGHVGSHPSPVAAKPATAPLARKSRKTGAPAPKKRSTAHPRSAPVHELSAKTAAEAEGVASAPSLPSRPPEVLPIPEAPTAPKARRRAPRKRKAPPVVSVTVEPATPPSSDDASQEPRSIDDSDPPPAPEG